MTATLMKSKDEYRDIAGPYYLTEPHDALQATPPAPGTERWMFENAVKQLTGCRIQIRETHSGTMIARHRSEYLNSDEKLS